MRDQNQKLTRLLAFLVLAPVVSGCSGSADFLSKDAEWFNRPQRLFIKSISIDAPPLTPEKPVTAEDLVSAEGACPGMAPAGANAMSSDAAAAPPAAGGTVALAIPNVTWCAASAHPTVSTSAVMAVIALRP